ncbi:MAG: hypothetical protein KJO55_01385, partial [Gammaproteobacteria bacterium]|nr:hypothetical protein [Gammaproteobacteria bacterium]
MRHSARASVVLIALLLAACGFQLRGASLLPPSMARIELQAAETNSVIYNKLEAELKRSGVELVAQGGGATTTL